MQPKSDERLTAWVDQNGTWDPMQPGSSKFGDWQKVVIMATWSPLLKRTVITSAHFSKTLVQAVFGICRRTFSLSDNDEHAVAAIKEHAEIEVDHRKVERSELDFDGVINTDAFPGKIAEMVRDALETGNDQMLIDDMAAGRIEEIRKAFVGMRSKIDGRPIKVLVISPNPLIGVEPKHLHLMQHFRDFRDSTPEQVFLVSEEFGSLRPPLGQDYGPDITVARPPASVAEVGHEI